jgi:hypothetical protein
VELPHLEGLADEFRKDGIDLISVSNMIRATYAGDSAKVAAALVGEIGKLTRMAQFHKMTMPVSYAVPGSAFARDYNLMYGTVVVIDRGGRILSVDPIEVKKLRTSLERLAATKVAVAR